MRYSGSAPTGERPQVKVPYVITARLSAQNRAGIKINIVHAIYLGFDDFVKGVWFPLLSERGTAGPLGWIPLEKLWLGTLGL